MTSNGKGYTGYYDIKREKQWNNYVIATMTSKWESQGQMMCWQLYHQREMQWANDVMLIVTTKGKPKEDALALGAACGGKDAIKSK